MSARSILKATQAGDAPAVSVVLRSPREAMAVPEAPPGSWISQADLEALKKRCFEQGRAEGEEQGRRLAQLSARQKAEEETAARLEHELKERHDRYVREQAEKWRGLATALAGQARALRQQMESEVTEWTFVAVTRLLGQRTRDDAAAAVRKVLEECRVNGPLTVLLHAQDHSNLVASGAAEADAWPEGVSFAADARVGLGGCLIQSDAQALDARLEVQLALLRESLDELRRERCAVEG